MAFAMGITMGAKLRWSCLGQAMVFDTPFASQYNGALMSNGPIPQFIDPRKLADRGTVIDGLSPLSAFSRLAEAALDSDGQVRARIVCQRDEQGAVLMSMNFDAEVHLQCQRCLEEVSVPLKAEYTYAVVPEGAPVASVADGHDILEVGEAPLNLRVLLEDELLMALPIVPVHPVTECQMPVNAHASQVTAEETAKENPFSVLAQLKQDPKL